MNFTKTKINLNYLNIKNQTLCKNNPILDLLPKDLYSDVLELINDIPIQTDSDICKLSNSDVKYSSCCNKNIIEIFMTFFTEKMIKIKNEIFSKNIFFFSEILSEHNRNFIDGFGLDSSNFLILFKDFIDYKNEIYSLSKIIVEDSLKYFWSSLCNYVCREDNFKLFQVYNITYIKIDGNNSLSDKGTSVKLFEFVNNFQRVNLIKENLGKFYIIEKNFENKLTDIYKNISSNTRNYKYTNYNNETGKLIQKSLEDGRNFFINSKKNSPCEKTDNNTLFSCEELLDNICLPFLCLDNIFFQLIDSSAEPIDYKLESYNYTNSIYWSVENKSIEYFSFDNDITDTLNKSILFNNDDKKIISFYKKEKILNIIVLFLFTLAIF